MAESEVNVETLSEQRPNDTGITKFQARESSSIIKLSESLNNTNWTVWREQMKHVLRLCGVEEYAEGRVVRCHDDAMGVK